MKNGFKKLLVFVITIQLVACLAACGDKNKDPKVKNETVSELKTKRAQKVDLSKPEEIKEYNGSVKDLGAQVSETISLLKKEQGKLEKNVGTSFEGYRTHQEDINGFYKLILSESKICFDQLSVESLGYFKRIFREYGKDEEKLENAIDDYYDDIYDGVLDDYYDEVYDGILDQLYDDYYDGVLDDAMEKMDYDEWSRLSTKEYRLWSKASSDTFKLWVKTGSGCTSMWSEASRLLWQGNRDTNQIMTKLSLAYLRSQAGPTEVAQEEEKISEDSQQSDEASEGIRIEFKEALDSYEEFVDEYISFLKEFQESDDITSMMDDYNSYFIKYTDTMDKIQKLDSGDLSTEEAAYYLEVVTRITQKLAAAM